MCVCNFNNVCFLPKENQYVKSPYKRFFFSFDKEEMCLLSSHAASGHVHFPNFMCIQKEGHVTGHSHSLEGYHKRPEMQKWPWHDCMKKSSVYRALKCPALCKFGDWSVATGIQELKSFSLNESTAVTFRLVKPWGNHNHNHMRSERWVCLPLPTQIYVLTVHLLELCGVFSTNLTIHNDFLAPSSVLPSVQSWR